MYKSPRTIELEHGELIDMLKQLREAFYVKGTTKDVRNTFNIINDRFKEIIRTED